MYKLPNFNFQTLFKVKQGYDHCNYISESEQHKKDAKAEQHDTEEHRKDAHQRHEDDYQRHGDGQHYQQHGDGQHYSHFMQ